MMSSIYELKEPSNAVAWVKICAVMSEGSWIVFVASCAKANAGKIKRNGIV